MPTSSPSPTLAPDVAHAASATSAPPLWRDYLELTKPEISFLVVISALAGFLLGSPEGLDGWVLAATLVGVALTSGGACVLNHYLEREIDGAMKRTSGRPLPTGRIAPQRALYFGLGLAGAGVAIICPIVNPLTAGLALLTGALYLFLYTPLKRKTKYNTVVGTIPGALPALGGWTAATGSVGAGGLAIFAVLALWQMPHFLSLAWMYRKDYGRAAYAMLPVVEPDGRSTALQTLLCTGGLLAASLLPTLLGIAGLVYLAAALVLGGGFLVPAWRFYRARTNQNARRVLKASIYYVPLLVLAIFVDWLL